MSVDGRDESQGGDTGELDAPQVPPQRERRDESVLPPLRELPPADADLIASMRAGDDSAYEELYRRHADAVRRYARTCCRDGHTADDLTAEVFARMLQAVRGGSGPEYAVRAYLLTSVRRVAAQWTQSAKREQLVDDFAVFAAQAAGRASEVGDDDTLELGADVRAMHEAEQSMAMQAFRSLPERWQAVLWHTEVEDESPSEVATLFGLDANGTRVLASRAREGLKQAYLQAHVSATLTSDEECSRYADQLGTYARKRLRTRAERGLRKHLEECAKCRLAALQIEEVASGIPAVVPIAVIGWFGAAGYAKAAALIAGGVGAGAAGVGGAAAAANGGSGAAASEGLGAPVKAGIAAGVVAVAAAAVALALVGNDEPVKTPAAPPPSSAPVVRQEVPPSPSPSPSPSREVPEPVVVAPAPSAKPPVKPRPPAPKPAPVVPRPTPSSPAPSPTPSAEPSPTPTPTPPRPPAVYPLNQLAYNANGDGTNPEIRLFESSWVWQRDSLSIAGRSYSGVTVRAGSSVTIDLNRTCTSYDALVGIDDTTLRLGQAYFAVYADGVRLWRSGLVKGGDPAVPVHVDLTGRKTVRLVVEPYTPFDELALVDWAESRFRCS
ncbi:sigma-70 family RNA polymerase sigma factor [Streptomyces niveiscabiei]|uniref:sigma-70 family RNA polymerase sigma factor n=1 Tax=Streptomyces niveiscabiei TaxID=164115 RepID=UPI0029B083DD|nr:sigma-70 family RNA polymerase sigma factor [Streptomyces niveiscabiei]MDX3385335.1 sigma-70 family RNA polymerase sigma factor [Streptomyces niveiscabiei]